MQLITVRGVIFLYFLKIIKHRKKIIYLFILMCFAVSKLAAGH